MEEEDTERRIRQAMLFGGAVMTALVATVALLWAFGLVV